MLLSARNTGADPGFGKGGARDLELPPMGSFRHTAFEAYFHFILAMSISPYF